MKLWTMLRVAFATVLTLACMAETAHADPITALLGAAFTAIQSIGALSPLLSAALSFGAKTLLSAIMAPKTPTANTGVRQKLDSGGDNPLSFVMGHYATSGKLIYVNEFTEGDHEENNILTLVVSLGEVPNSALSTFVHINGEKCTIDPANVDADGFMAVTDYFKNDIYYCRVKFVDGSQMVADPFLLAKFAADADKPWTSDMIGRGCSYVIVRCIFSDEGVWSGIPEFKWIVNGIKLYDPRKDSTVGGSGSQRWTNPSTWAFSENPKVMQFNVILGIYYGDTWIYGGQADRNTYDHLYQLPLSYWFAAMNVCDEDVTTAAGPTIKRYTAGCEITVDSQPIDVIKELDKCCAGYTAEYGGLWKTWCGAPGASVFSFTDADIIITEEQTDNLFRSLQDTYNGARATYVNQNAGWVMKDAAPRLFDGTHGTDDLVTEDGGYQLIADLQLPMVTNSNQAQRLMRLAVLDNRRQITHVLQLPPEAGFLEPFDVTTWTSARNGYDHKKCRVESIEDLPNCNQLVLLRELDPDDYDWDTSFELPETVGTLTPVKPGLLALDFSVYPDQVDNDTGGKDKPAIRLQWTWGAPDLDLRSVRYQIRKTGTTKVIASGHFDNINDGNRVITSTAFRFGKTYQARIQPVPARPWRQGAWTGWQDVTLFDVDIPSAPTLTRISALGDDGTLDFSMDIDWTSVAGEATYAVRIAITGGTTRTYKTQESHYRLTGVTSGQTFTVDVRAVAADGGSVGSWSTTTTITITKKNTAPTAPVSLSLVADFHKLILDWPASPDKDFNVARVYEASVNNFASASAIKDIKASGWTRDGLGNLVTRYYWITFLDRSGNESAKWPTSNTAGISGTTTVVTDSDTDDTGPATPSSLSVSQKTNLNGDGKVDLDLVYSWVGIANKKASYVLRVFDGTDYDYFKVHDNGAGTPTPVTKRVRNVQSGTVYTTSVAAVSGSGVIGSYTSNVTITPSKKATAPSTPIDLSLVADFHKLILDWPASPDRDFDVARVYEATVNNFASASAIKDIKATGWTRGGLGNLVTRYYWITFLDRTGNESAKFPTSNTGGISGTTTTVTDNDTDGTGPATPSSLTVTQKTNLNGDGKVDLDLVYSWVGIANKKASYVLRVFDGTDYDYFKVHDNGAGTPTPVTKRVRNVQSGTVYTASVAAVSGSGVIGSYTSNLTITPSKKATAPSTPTGLVTTAGVARARLTWPKSTDADYKETVEYQATVNNFASAVEAGRKTGTTDIVDGLANSTTYYFWITHVDRSGNESAKWPTSNTAGVAVTTKLVVDADTDQSAPSTPSAPTVTQVPKALNGDGVVDMSLKLTGVMPSGAKSIEFEVDFNFGGAPDLQYFPAKGLGTRIGPVIAGQTYPVKVRGRSFNDTAGPLSSATSITPSAKTAAPTTPTGVVISSAPLAIDVAWNSIIASDPDYNRTEIYYDIPSTAPTSGSVPSLSAIGNYANIHVGIGGVPFYVWIRHVNNSGIKTAWVAASPTHISTDDLFGASIGDPDVVVSAGTAALVVGGVGTYGFFKNNTATIINIGATTAASNLTYSDTGGGGTTNPSGTWQCMTRCAPGMVSLFMRIS